MKKTVEAEPTVSAHTNAATLQRKIAAAKKRREKLLAEIAENPSEELQKKLARLEKSIEKDSDALHLQVIDDVSAGFETLMEMLPRLVESQDAQELLRLGDETFAATTLSSLRLVRNRLFDSTMILSANETIKSFLRRIDEAVSQGEDDLEKKRRQAAIDFPELARKFAPTYAMPAEYNEMLANFVEHIERRDRMTKNLVNLPPHKRRDLLKQLAEADKLMNAAEEKLASHYEKYQQYEQYMDGWRKMLAKFSRTERYQLREYFKENPGGQPVAEKLLREEFSDDDDY